MNLISSSHKIIILILIFIPATINYADDSALRYNLDSGTVFMIENNSIIMEEEYVEYKDGEFKAIFHFKNTLNEKVSCKIGFPVYGNANRLGLSSFHPVTDLPFEELKPRIEEYYNFRSYINGNEITRELIPAEKDDNYDYYFVSTVDFEPDEAIIITDIFNYTPLKDESSTMDRSYTINYILKSGATWKDRIGKAVIRIYIPEEPDFCYFFDPQYAGRFRKFQIISDPHPSTILYDDGQTVYEWEFFDLEPDFDIKLAYEYSDRGMYSQGIDFFAISSSGIEAILNDYMIDKNYESKSTDPAFFTTLNDKVFFRNHYLPAIYDYITLENYSFLNDEKRLLYIRFAINSIYAVNNYKFSTEPMQKLFNNFTWYEAKTANPRIDGYDEELLQRFKELRTQLSD